MSRQMLNRKKSSRFILLLCFSEKINSVAPCIHGPQRLSLKVGQCLQPQYQQSSEMHTCSQRMGKEVILLALLQRQWCKFVIYVSRIRLAELEAWKRIYLTHSHQAL